MKSAGRRFLLSEAHCQHVGGWAGTQRASTSRALHHQFFSLLNVSLRDCSLEKEAFFLMYWSRGPSWQRTGCNRSCKNAAEANSDLFRQLEARHCNVQLGCYVFYARLKCAWEAFQFW